MVEASKTKSGVDQPEAFRDGVSNVVNLLRCAKVLTQPLIQIANKEVPCSEHYVVLLNGACEVECVCHYSQRDDG